MQLAEIAHARSGDKTGSSNIAVIARRRADAERIGRALKPARIRKVLGLPSSQPVKVYPVPRLGAFNIFLPGALEGAPTYTLRFDVFGKSFAGRILALEVDDE